MHVGIFMPKGIIHPLQHLHRLLRRCTAVEEDQTIAVNSLGQDREIGTDFFKIEGHLTLLTGGRPARAGNSVF